MSTTERSRLPPLASLLPGVTKAPIAWALLALSLAATWIAWAAVDRLDTAQTSAHFRADTQRLADAVSDRMQKQEQALRGAAGLFAASSAVTRAEWKAYTDALHLAEHYPGMLGIGFAVVVHPQDKTRHVQSLRAEGFKTYEIRPLGVRDMYTPVVFLEPFAGRNLRAFGYDMFSEPTRRAAMERARDTGEMTVSGIVTLVQETDKDIQRGFLMFVPIYRNGALIATVQQRRAALTGFVYSPFRANDLMAGILGDGANQIDLHILDANEVFFDSDKADDEPRSHDLDRLITRAQIAVGGRNWRLDFAAKPDFEQATASSEPLLVVVGGTVISLLLFFVVASLSTQRKRAEALVDERTKQLQAAQVTLEQSRARFRDLTELSSDWSWETNADCVIERITEGANSLKLVEPRDFVGLRLAVKQGPGTTDEEWAEHIKAVAERRPFRQHTFRILGHDGSTRTLSSTAKPVFGAQGNFAGYIGTTRDVTLEVNARAEIGEAKKRLIQAMEVAPGGISIVDANGYLVESNSASRDARTRNGQFTEIGKPYKDILDQAIKHGGGEIGGDPTPPTGESLYNRLRECGPPFEARLGRHWYLVRSARLSDDTLVVGSSDITQLKAREREFAEAKDVAEAASRYKTEFLATMSHELRNPLTSIIGALSIIIANPGGALPEKVVRLMNMALDNSRRLVKLINETLDVEKIESGLATFNVAPLKLIDPVRRAVDAMRGLAAGRGISITLDPDSTHEVVRGDADRLQQVVINLLSNAIKFSPPKGDVAVSVRPAGANLRLSIADRGPGIPAAFHTRIFERFAQATDAGPVKEGSGLGLAIAKSIVVQLGGAISFETTEGQGTTFHVDLPRAAAETAQGEAA